MQSSTRLRPGDQPEAHAPQPLTPDLLKASAITKTSCYNKPHRNSPNVIGGVGDCSPKNQCVRISKLPPCVFYWLESNVGATIKAVSATHKKARYFDSFRYYLCCVAAWEQNRVDVKGFVLGVVQKPPAIAKQISCLRLARPTRTSVCAAD
jgi:hypothetical protein